MKITTALLRDLEQKVTVGDISYSRMVEILNETAKATPDLNEVELEYFHYEHSSGGNRYFKVDRQYKRVWQICLSAGSTQKGRTHCIGIYRMAYTSFAGTYYWHYEREGSVHTKMKKCDESEYKKAMEELIKQF